jgi:hypothetical protein
MKSKAIEVFLKKSRAKRHNNSVMYKKICTFAPELFNNTLVKN